MEDTQVEPVDEVTEVIEEPQSEGNQDTEEIEATEDNGVEDTEPSEEENTTDQNKKNASIRYRRHHALKSKNEELEMQNEYLSQQLRQQGQPAQPQQPVQYRDPSAKPMLADYEDPDQWADDRDAWSRKQLDQTQRVTKVSNGYADKCKEYAENNPSFQEDCSNSPMLSKMNSFVTDMVKKSPEAGRITHLLANDDRLASDLNNMDYSDAMRKVIEMEGKPEKKAPVVSSAHKPISQTKGSAPTIKSKISNMSGSEYRAYMNSKRKKD